ncbi:NAD(P)H-binding protein [Herbiconiux sp. CPCC 205763]|uniref:NAD(P)H-binding protein n=1 Tax=Herbiconiux aconitum TaxID=2970913 RepID=A0ABT2GQ61_9MICO|nr:NAD(P)H-binding protein [Herbiconiux aconitum]MCS5718347.1 NAD(P)H-binding protein [Herbiconiux aconitum]
MRIAVAGGTGAVGRRVVAALVASGHDAFALTRSSGHDLTATDAQPALVSALAGCAATIDVTSVATTSSATSTRFFGAVTGNLLAAERAAGVPHHIILSIVGAVEAPAAYYAGKKLQEDLVMASSGGWSILRATQFHEFAAQMVEQGRMGPVQVVPTMRSQPVAAADVAEVLVEIALGEPRGLDRDLGGPQEENMADMVRRYLAATGQKRPVLEVPLPGPWGHALRDGTLLPGATARRASQTFADWLAAL